MKGKLLTTVEVLKLKNGCKVYMEQCKPLDSVYGNVNGMYEINNTMFIPIDKNKNGTTVWTNGDAVKNEKVKVYLYEEEKEMKEYTFKEVIAKIEDGQEYKCTVDYANIKSIFKEDDGDITFNFANEKSERIIIDPKFRFILVQIPVQFMEAVEAKKEGKTVYCILNKIKTVYKSHCFWNQFDSAVTADEILLGEWYIE